MTARKGRRRFGSVRQCASGRWQARYVGPDGIERPAPHTFETAKAAERWLTVVESEIIKNQWHPPEAGEVELDAYATTWIAERKPAPRTRENYEDLVRLHPAPSRRADDRCNPHADDPHQAPASAGLRDS